MLVFVMVAHAHHAGRRDGGGVDERIGHEGEDVMEGDGADGGEAVDVAEVEFSGEEEEGAEEGEEKDGSGEIGVVHYVLVYAGDGIEDCEGLFSVGKYQ